ncbi:NADH oxidoreductase hcr [compost metagenome]
MIFADELAALAEAHPGVRHALVLEQAPAAHPWVGRLTPSMLKELAPDLLGRHVYLCGPAPYMAAVSTMLAELGLAATQLHQESFGLPAVTSDAAPVAAGGDHFWLTLKKSGKKVKILPGQTLLAALEGAGETMAAACRAGVCGACRCTTTGEIERQSVMTLSSQDLESGVALACSCTARGDVGLDY